MSAKKKYYAIKTGKDPITGEVVIDKIITTWSVAQTYVIGVEGAKFAGFVTIEEAEDWLKVTNQAKKTQKVNDKLVKTKKANDKLVKSKPRNSNLPGIIQNSTIGLPIIVADIPDTVQDSSIDIKKPITTKHWGATQDSSIGLPLIVADLPDTVQDSSIGISKSIVTKLPETPQDILCCYVDGSFNDSIPNYSFGVVCVLNGSIVFSLGGAGTNAEAVSMRQIAGELLGAMQALIYAKKNNYKEVRIYHDYIGVDKHALGTWKRTNPFSVTYYNWMQEFFKNNKQMQVSFHKVAAHSGIIYNELADVLAKNAIDMTPEVKYEKAARELGLI